MARLQNRSFCQKLGGELRRCVEHAYYYALPDGDVVAWLTWVGLQRMFPDDLVHLRRFSSRPQVVDNLGN